MVNTNRNQRGQFASATPETIYGEDEDSTVSLPSLTESVRHSTRGRGKLRQAPQLAPLTAYPIPPVPIGDPLYGCDPEQVQLINENERAVMINLAACPPNCEKPLVAPITRLERLAISAAAFLLGELFTNTEYAQKKAGYLNPMLENPVPLNILNGDHFVPLYQNAYTSISPPSSPSDTRPDLLLAQQRAGNFELTPLPDPSISPLFTGPPKILSYNQWQLAYERLVDSHQHGRPPQAFRRGDYWPSEVDFMHFEAEVRTTERKAEEWREKNRAPPAMQVPCNDGRPQEMMVYLEQLYETLMGAGFFVAHRFAHVLPKASADLAELSTEDPRYHLVMTDKTSHLPYVAPKLFEGQVPEQPQYEEEFRPCTVIKEYLRMLIINHVPEGRREEILRHPKRFPMKEWLEKASERGEVGRGFYAQGRRGFVWAREREEDMAELKGSEGESS